MRFIFDLAVTILFILLLYALAPLLLVVIVVALLFGVGALVTRVFPVTLFEATLIGTLVGVPLCWFYYRALRRANLMDAERGAQAEPPEPPTVIEPLFPMPRRPYRRSKRGPR